MEVGTAPAGVGTPQRRWEPDRGSRNLAGVGILRAERFGGRDGRVGLGVGGGLVGRG